MCSGRTTDLSDLSDRKITLTWGRGCGGSLGSAVGTETGRSAQKSSVLCFPHPCPSGNQPCVVCVYEFVCTFVALCFLSHTSEISCGCCPFPSDLFHLAQYSQDPPMLWMAGFHLFDGWVVSHCIYVPHLLYLTTGQRILRLFPCLSYCE